MTPVDYIVFAAGIIFVVIVAVVVFGAIIRREILGSITDEKRAARIKTKRPCALCNASGCDFTGCAQVCMRCGGYGRLAGPDYPNPPHLTHEEKWTVHAHHRDLALTHARAKIDRAKKEADQVPWYDLAGRGRAQKKYIEAMDEVGRIYQHYMIERGMDD